MSQMKYLNINSLSLDLNNYRTIHQENEINAINTMIAIHPEWFWALMESLMEDGYHATENIIVIKNDTHFIVKEGNRRIAALKLIFKLVTEIEVPDSINNKIQSITNEWKKENEAVPCSIYNENESAKVEKIISLIHAKGDKAGRDKWTAVARARYNRDQKQQPEFALDLLEKYLIYGKNISELQIERWSGEYPLTVLVDAIQKIFMHLDYKSANELVDSYPKKNKTIFDKILFDIGIQNLGFKEIRDKQMFFGSKYGINQKDQNQMPGTSSKNDKSSDALSDSSSEGANDKASSSPVAQAKEKAQSLNEPRAVYRKLKKLILRGNGREKIVTLHKEIMRLKIDKHPHAFCFLLRSMFEISAKAYCADYKGTGGPNVTEKNGNDKSLAKLLGEITNHITANNTDKEKVKLLHGSMTEISKPQGLLSVTSMNQLVHNQTFSIAPHDICITFYNIFPLLEEMNK